VLDATWSILRDRGVDGLSIEAIARAAEVGRQTIYRWWPSKAAIVFEAASKQARLAVPSEPRTGTLRGDLRAFLRATYAAAGSEDIAPILRALALEALRDEQFAESLRRFTDERRAVLRTLLRRGDASAAQARFLADLAFALLWDRTVIGHAPLDRRTADAVADMLGDAVAVTR